MTMKINLKKMKLFIDDIRSAPDDSWITVRNSEEAIHFIEQNGISDVISFDHDLGGDDTSMKIVNAIVEMVLDGKTSFPDNVIFFVHSDNPVGAENIVEAILGFMGHLDIEYKNKVIRLKNGEQFMYS